jgi:hypothetical protein
MKYYLHTMQIDNEKIVEEAGALFKKYGVEYKVRTDLDPKLSIRPVMDIPEVKELLENLPLLKELASCIPMMQIIVKQIKEDRQAQYRIQEQPKVSEKEQEKEQEHPTNVPEPNKLNGNNRDEVNRVFELLGTRRGSNVGIIQNWLLMKGPGSYTKSDISKDTKLEIEDVQTTLSQMGWKWKRYPKVGYQIYPTGVDEWVLEKTD